MTKYVVMFSSGAGSWAAARRIRDQEPDAEIKLLFADTRTEDEDNYRFLIESAADIFGVVLPKWWRHPWPGRAHTRVSRMFNRLNEMLPQLVWVRDGRDVWEVFNDDRMIGNTRISNCSRTLKQRPAHRWLKSNADDETVVVVGIDWTETHRLPVIERNYASLKTVAPLCDAPYLARGDIFAELARRGIARPRLYDLGFAHANCGGFCVRAGQGQFAQLLSALPERYAEHEARENAFRESLGKDVSILRDRRGGLTKPLTLTALRKRIENAPEQVDSLDLGGCGCFTTEDSSTKLPRPRSAAVDFWDRTEGAELDDDDNA